MKKSHTIFVVAMTAAALGGSAIAASANTSNSNAKADWLEIPAIYEKVTTAGYKNIHEIERERRGYDVEAYDSNGNRVELFVDPTNGEVLDVNVKKKSGKHHDKRERYSNDD